MPPPLHLRSATPADLPALYQLDLLCFTEPFRFDLRTMRHYASQANAIVLVAHAAGPLLGFILINVTRRPGLNSGYITTLDVHPEHRRQGVAHILLQQAEATAIQAGVRSLRLHVSAANTAAIRFYEGAGFHRQGGVEHFYAENLHAWIYLKNLIPLQPVTGAST